MNDLPFGLLKPCRWYDFVTEPAGETWLVMKVYPQPNSNELTEGDFIPPAEIAEWSKPFRFALNEKYLEVLSTVLNTMRVTTHASEDGVVHADQNDLIERTLRNIATLSDDIPKVIQLSRKTGGNRAEAVAKLLEYLLERVSRVAAALPPPRPKPNRLSSWHDDAKCLADILNEAAAREKVEIGFGKPDAIGVRFIDSALTRAGVSHGSADAISKLFNRTRAKRV